MSELKKINLGQYNTKKSVWLKPQVEKFIKETGCKHGLDPFAGSGDLINVMTGLGLVGNIGFDIDRALPWCINDSLMEVPPFKDTIVITNPPYLAKNSAKEKNLSSYKYFDSNKYIDLYQIAIDRVISVYDYSVFIIPETFFSTDDFNNRINNITILEENPFEDTDVPICVVCFHKESELFNIDYPIYKNDSFIITKQKLDYIMDKLNCRENLKIVFNEPLGNLGLRAIDGTSPDDRIRFCKPHELDYDLSNIKVSSRAISVLNVEFAYANIDIDSLIIKSNEVLETIRENTYDIILSPFKNNNKEGERRRRLDYKLARKILNFSAGLLTSKS